MKVEIHKEANCAWAEVNGQFIYGKDVHDVELALDAKAKHGEISDLNTSK